MARKSIDPVEKLAVKIGDSSQVSGKKTFVTLLNAAGQPYTDALEVSSFAETVDRIKASLRELPRPILEQLMQKHNVRVNVTA
ncbi:MAG: hypothetical protein PHG25_00860 [Candidatus Pacebacteria bacterium]|nr:hypothetical protein [Candidatus Paceibacterota bacterium]